MGRCLWSPPPGYEKEGIARLLLKGLYGIKQAGRIRHERIRADMGEFGFVQRLRDYTVFRNWHMEK